MISNCTVLAFGGPQGQHCGHTMSEPQTRNGPNATSLFIVKRPPADSNAVIPSFGKYFIGIKMTSDTAAPITNASRIATHEYTTPRSQPMPSASGESRR